MIEQKDKKLEGNEICGVRRWRVGKTDAERVAREIIVKPLELPELGERYCNND